MYFKQKSNVIFRDYGDFGYITDNRNFGYQKANDEQNDIGDKIVSQTGIVFLSVLGKEAQELDCLVKKISSFFIGIDVAIIKRDAEEFYRLLETDGFLVSGNTLQECNEKDFYFSYGNVKSIEVKNIQPKLVKKETQGFFDEYFGNRLQLTNLHIEITSRCNERCVHCYIPNENKIRDINADLFYSILEQCSKMNVLHLTLSGGEPMLHKNFIDFLKKCNEYNFSVNILSNLTLLNEDILTEMKKNHLLSVQVSLYSMNPIIHDTITQVKGSFEKTKKAILVLRENNIPLQISCPIMRQNADCYESVVEWGKGNNINVGSDYVIIAKYNHTTQNLDNRLSIENIEKIINKEIKNNPYYIEQIKKEAAQKENIEPSDFICSVCHSSLCISESGSVYPCAGWQDYILGDIKQTELIDIWQDSLKIKYLRELRRKDFPECIQCPEKEFCTMCMVRNANESPTGNPLEVNKFFCDIAKLNKKISIQND